MVWARHITWAKVLVAGIAALHESKIVHADLKPANAYLIKDASIAAGYQLKLIDMDFSLLADRRAPWHGYQGYVGSDNYRSPEHLTRGGVPTTASDIFTCGLILYELLAGHHPYWTDEPGRYAELVNSYSAKPPALVGHLSAPASNSKVSAALYRCLAPDSELRPTATELRAVLSGRSSEAGVKNDGPPIEVSKTVSISPSDANRDETVGRIIETDQLELAATDRHALTFNIRTELGRPLVQQLGPDGAFWDTRQCVLMRDAHGRWTINPIHGTTNETLVNGKAVKGPQLLRHGDQIGVGRQAAGLVKLPLTARGR